MKMKASLLAVVLVSLIFSSCYRSKKLTLATHVKGTPIEKIGKDMASYLKTKGLNIKILSGNEYNTKNNVRLLVDKKVNLAILSNKVTLNKTTNTLRTLIPIYPVVATVLCRDSLSKDDFRTLIKNYKIGYFPEDADFFMSLFTYFGADTTRIDTDLYPKFKSVEQGIWHIDHSNVGVICLFSVVPSRVVKNLLSRGWTPKNMSNNDENGPGSSIEGFCLGYPSTYPYVVPKYIYGTKQTEPIYSIATDYILAARDDLDHRLAYDLVKDIIQGKAYLSQINPTATHITEDFNRNALTLPLHEGALNYFDRNKPSFFVRYAEPIGLGFSILMVVAGGLTSLKKVKKERIDKYYKKVTTAQSHEELIALKEQALIQLEKERLSADEAFNIFLTIIDQKMRELDRQKNETKPR